MTIRFHIRETGISAPAWVDVKVNEDSTFSLPALELHEFITYCQVLLIDPS